MCYDESKLKIFGLDDLQLVWTKVVTTLEVCNIKPTVKHSGGTIKMLGAMTSKGTELLHINQKKATKIDEFYIPS